MEAEGRLFGGRRPTPGGLGAKPPGKKQFFLDFFGFLYGFLGPGGFGNGPGLDSAPFGQSFSPNGPFWIRLGYIFDFQFFGNPYGVPFWAQPALMGTHGGRRPTFWRPKADAGGSGGEAPSKMGPFGALLGTPVWKILSRLVEHSYLFCALPRLRTWSHG